MAITSTTVIPLADRAMAVQSNDHGSDLTTAPISQGAAGTTDIIAANATLPIVIVALVAVISANGTVQFKYGAGATNLSGAIPLLASGGIALSGGRDNPIMVVPTNSKLTLVSTGGAVTGWVTYLATY